MEHLTMKKNEVRPKSGISKRLLIKKMVFLLLLTGLSAGAWGQKKASDYEEAAGRGDSEAQYMLGVYYSYGQGGVSEDKAKGLSWYRKAAEQGNTYAQKALAKLQEKTTPSTSATTNQRVAAAPATTNQNAQAGGWIKSVPEGITGADTELFKNFYHYTTTARYSKWAVPQKEPVIHIVVGGPNAVVTIVFANELFKGSREYYFEVNGAQRILGTFKMQSEKWFWLEVNTEHVKESSLNINMISDNKQYQSNINAMVNEWQLRFKIPQFTVHYAESSEKSVKANTYANELPATTSANELTATNNNPVSPSQKVQTWNIGDPESLSGPVTSRVTATLNNGVLTINGIGRMASLAPTKWPWHAVRSSIVSVNISQGVTDIGLNAFVDCTGLISVSIPNSVTSIGGRAFEGCKGLSTVTIPNSITSIGGSAFEGCTGLTSISIPNNVKTLHENAFKDCTGLSTVTIPNSVMEMYRAVFEGCSGLTSAIIGNGVPSIDETFNGCTGLTSVTIGIGVKNISDYAFRNCKNITSVVCMRTSPPYAPKAFENARASILYVPNSSIRAYGYAPGWDKFSRILAVQTQ